MNYEFVGTVTEVFPSKTVGQKGFQKRSFRVREDKESKYVNIVEFTLKGDKCALADSISVNDKVKVHFAVSGRIWAPEDKPTRCFIDLECFKIDIMQKIATPSMPDVPSMDGFSDGEDIPF